MTLAFMDTLFCRLTFNLVSFHANFYGESSPKLVEIFHGSDVHVTQPSLLWLSQFSNLVAGPHVAWASADSP